MDDKSDWVTGITGNFPLHQAVVDAMPRGSYVISAESSGISAWTRTAKITARSANEKEARYFLKCSTGESARALAEGEFQSALRLNEVVSDFIPKPIGWGRYADRGADVYFFLGAFHDMDFSDPPDPANFIDKIVHLHKNGTSPNGMFGFDVPTVCGRMQRTVTWEKTWAASFTHQLKDMLRYDLETNGEWEEFRVTSNHVIEKVIPRLLGALQSEGRSIKPTLIHGDLWERNVGIDMDTGEPVFFDPGCTYAHNEMEFGNLRCSWSIYFNSPIWMRLYQQQIPPSEPADEWDDRNRLYSIYQYLVESAGHPGSPSRKIVYNDMLYLCEQYAPLDSLEKYDPEQDVKLSGLFIPVPFEQLE